MAIASCRFTSRSRVRLSRSRSRVASGVVRVEAAFLAGSVVRFEAASRQRSVPV